jgi:hypothetical protein
MGNSNKKPGDTVVIDGKEYIVTDQLKRGQYLLRREEPIEIRTILEDGSIKITTCDEKRIIIKSTSNK